MNNRWLLVIVKTQRDDELWKHGKYEMIDGLILRFSERALKHCLNETILQFRSILSGIDWLCMNCLFPPAEYALLYSTSGYVISQIATCPL